MKITRINFIPKDKCVEANVTYKLPVDCDTAVFESAVCKSLTDLQTEYDSIILNLDYTNSDMKAPLWLWPVLILGLGILIGSALLLAKCTL